MQRIDYAGARTAPEARLAAFETGGGTTAEILALFDSLPPVSAVAIRGRWRGTGLPSGHPWDGLLERFGWYGKEFNGPEDVHPLLCKGRSGSVFALNPALVPMGLVNRHIGLFHTRSAGAVFALAGRAAATRRPTARLRMTEFRGVVTATMIYDSLPIHDMFRAATSETLLGVMDLRGMTQPLFFVLHRDGLSRPAW
jgi:hypothetical protein